MNITPTTPPLAPEPEKQPEATAVVAPEVVTPPVPETVVPTTPEVTAPKAPEVDHLSTVAQPVLAADPQDVPVDPVVVDDSQDPIIEPETVNETEIDKKYFKAADEVIDMFEDKPFEEEEKTEDLNQGYLHERFGKDIPKSEDD